jgi:hypothetical protein
LIAQREIETLLEFNGTLQLGFLEAEARGANNTVALEERTQSSFNGVQLSAGRTHSLLKECPLVSRARLSNVE